MDQLHNIIPNDILQCVFVCAHSDRVLSHVWMVKGTRPNTEGAESNYFPLLTMGVFFLYLHSTHDVGRLCFATMGDVLHVGDRSQQVHIEPSCIKVPVHEQFNVRGEVILGNTIQGNDKKGNFFYFSHFKSFRFPVH